MSSPNMTMNIPLIYSVLLHSTSAKVVASPARYKLGSVGCGNRGDVLIFNQRTTSSPGGRALSVDEKGQWATTWKLYIAGVSPTLGSSVDTPSRSCGSQAWNGGSHRGNFGTTVNLLEYLNISPFSLHLITYTRHG